MYADDTQIYSFTTFNELPNTLKEINSITTKLENYFNYNYLKFNLQKTECIIFHSKSHTPLHFISLTRKFISAIFSLHTIHLSHIHNVHCIPPSHAFPSHVTSLHILPQLLPQLFIYFEKRIIYYINFVIFH